MRRLIIQVLLVLMSVLGMAQSGPGGIGRSDGSSSLLLWLDADFVQQDSGNHIGLWLDRSGHGNHAYPESGLGPTFSKDFKSKRGVINFNSEWGDHLIVENNKLMSPDELSLYVVGKISEESEDWAGFVLKEFGANWANGYGIGRNDTLKELIGFTTDFMSNGINVPFEYNQWNLVSLHHGKSELEFLSQGVSKGKKPVLDSIAKNNATMWIGWTGSHLDGQIADIIMFDKRSSTVERRLIENYLATKYHLFLEEDLYPFEEEGFDANLSGLGKDIDGSHHDNSVGPGIVRMNSPTDLNEGEYLLWANNELNEKELAQVELPNGVTSCLKKIWRIAETNVSAEEVDVGNVNVSFDLNDFCNVNLSDVVLLIDSDNNGSFINDEPITSGEVIGTGKIQFSNVAQLAHKVMFTVGSTSLQSDRGFDIYLKYFKNEIIDSAVYLTWKIAGNIDESAFLVEKSVSKGKFQLVERVSLDSIADTTTQFHIIDMEAKLGYTIYRLLRVSSEGDTLVLAQRGFDYGVAMHSYSDWIIEDQRKRMNQEKEKSQYNLKIVAFYIAIVLVILLFIVCFFIRRFSKAKNERDFLLRQIAEIKTRGVALSVSEPGNRKDLELDKIKIEMAIESKLGESAWMILNLIFEDPSVSNKDIADKVSLSIEGVSSSLRRMYTIFDITTPSNKKIALIMKASEISSNL